MDFQIRALSRFMIGVIAVILTCLFNPRVVSAEQVNAVDTLEGLKKIFVQIQPIRSNRGDDREMMNRLKRNTENQLRRAGIELLSEQDYDRLSRAERYPLARLFIALSIHDTGRMDMKMYSIAVQVRQMTFLGRRPVIKMMSPTWEIRKIGLEENTDVVFNLIANMVERFIGDFKMANGLN